MSIRSVATGTPATGVRPTLTVRGLSKKYGSHYAIRDINLDFYPGEVHNLFGENGAGKSTLISLLSGALQPTEGVINFEGKNQQLSSVAAARDLAIRAVFQEFSLIPYLTVAENIVLGEEDTGAMNLLSKKESLAKATKLIKDLGFELNPNEMVARLSRGKQQMVEICKAVSKNPKVLILDEPTASLSEHDTIALLKLVRKLQDDGCAVIYITHRIHEINQLGGRVSVLRDGRLIETTSADTPEEELIRLMAGRKVSDLYPVFDKDPGEVRLEVKNLSGAQGEVFNVNLQVRAGEIVGLAGLVGCGKSEVGQIIFGAQKKKEGTIFVDGKAVDFHHPKEAIASGVWYSPPDRKNDGLALTHAVNTNMVLSSLFFGAGKALFRRPIKEKKLVETLSGKVDFPIKRQHEPVANFSGGNQQKVLLAKSLAQDIEVYIFDEPTVGVDIGARQAIYSYLGSLVNRGAAVLLISSDLPELLGMSNRLLVMREGKTVAEFRRGQFEQQTILQEFFG